jgi:hypothetical protein
VGQCDLFDEYNIRKYGQNLVGFGLLKGLAGAEDGFVTEMNELV